LSRQSKPTTINKGQYLYCPRREPILTFSILTRAISWRSSGRWWKHQPRARSRNGCERRQRWRGIPIGNQTSQFFANVYLDPLDHFVRDQLGIKGYVRYVDDFLVFSDDKGHLADVREQIKDFLVSLRLRLHPKKSVIFPVKDGIRFLGYRVFSTHRLLPRENIRRFRRRVRGMQEDYSAGRVDFAEIYQRLTSWSGHARQANTYRLRCRLFDTISFQRATTE